MPYIIILNQYEGVELIINSLRASRKIAAQDLADGIAYHTIYQDENGKLTKLGEFEKPSEEKKKPTLTRIK
jgi:hypothetical protein